MLTPNAFELGWLTGQPIADVASATAAIRTLPPALRTVATSVPASGASALVNVVLAGDYTASLRVSKRACVPHGTGDLLSALICGRVANGQTFPAVVNDAVSELEHVINASERQDHLCLSAVIGAASLREVPDPTDVNKGLTFRTQIALSRAASAAAVAGRRLPSSFGATQHPRKVPTSS
jgi:pyridoxine kinase